MQTPRWPRRVRLAICALFAVALAAGIFSYYQGTYRATGADTRAAVSIAAAVPADQGPALSENSGRSVAGADQTYVANNAYLKKYTTSRGATLQLLPAYRYSGQIGFIDTQLAPIDVIGKTLSSGAASALFGLATSIWQLTLTLLQWSLTIDPLADLAKQINQMISGLTKGIWQSGLVAVALAALMFTLIKRVAAGKLAGIASIVLLAIVPLAAMQVFATRAEADNGNSNGATSVGSPLWLATSGTGKINSAVTSGLTTLSEKMSELGPGDSFNSYDNTGGVNDTSCESYFAEMTGKFTGARAVAAASDSKHPSNVDPSIFVDGESGTMVLVSRMWYEAMYRPWQSAQFGTANNGHYANYASCRYLEMRRQSPTPEQFAIVGGGDSTLVDGKWSGTVPGGPFTGFGTMPFVQTRGIPSDQLNMYGLIFPWAVCSVSDKDTTAAYGSKEYQQAPMVNGSQMGAGWRGISGDLNPASSNSADWVTRDAGNKVCSDWRGAAAPAVGISPSDHKQGYVQFGNTANSEGPSATTPVGTVGGGSDTLVPNDSAKTDEMTDGTDNNSRLKNGVPNAEAGDVDAVRADLLNVRDLYRSMQGHNAAQAVTSAFIALIGAGIYGWTLLGLAIGTIVAQFSFAVMLALLPISLFLAAFARNNPKGNPGVRMLKMTAAFGLTKVALVALLTLFIIITVFIRNIVNGVSDGFVGDIMTLASPILAFVMLRSLLKKMGFGDIMSPAGAASLSTQAMATMAGEKQAGRSFTEGLRKTGDAGTAAATMGIGMALGAYDGATRNDKRKAGAAKPQPALADDGMNKKKPETNKDPNSLAHKNGMKPLLDKNGKPVLDAAGNPMMVPAGETAATDAAGNPLLDAAGNPITAPSGMTPAVDGQGRPITGPDGHPVLIPLGMAAVLDKQGNPVLDSNGMPTLAPADSNGRLRASATALDRATEVALDADIAARTGRVTLPVDTALDQIGAAENRHELPNAQGGMNTPTYAAPEDVEFAKLGARGAVAPDGQTLGDGLATGALAARGVETEGTLTNVDSDAQAVNVDAYANHMGMDPGTVLASPVAELTPLANGTKLIDGEQHIPVIYDADGNVDVGASLNAGGISQLLDEELSKAARDVSLDLSARYNLDTDAADYITTLSAGRIIGAVDSSGQVANMATLYPAEQIGNIKVALEQAAKAGQSTVHLTQASQLASQVGAISPEQFTAALTAAASAMAVRVSRDPVPNATAWSGQAAAAVTEASHSAEHLAASDTTSDRGATMSKLESAIDELHKGMNTLAVAIAAVSVSDATATPNDAAKVADDGRGELDALRAQVQALVDTLNAKGAGTASDASPTATAELNATINSALKEYQKIMERQLDAIRASHDNAAKALMEAVAADPEDLASGGDFAA